MQEGIHNILGSQRRTRLAKTPATNRAKDLDRKLVGGFLKGNRSSSEASFGLRHCWRNGIRIWTVYFGGIGQVGIFYHLLGCVSMFSLYFLITLITLKWTKSNPNFICALKSIFKRIAPLLYASLINHLTGPLSMFFDELAHRCSPQTDIRCGWQTPFITMNHKTH